MRTVAPFIRDEDLTEKQFSRQVYDLAKAYNWRRYHTFRSERSPAGYPDETMVRERILFAELKTEKGKPSPLQVEWLDALRAAGGEAYLWRPSDLSCGEVVKVLAYRGPPPPACPHCGRVFVHRPDCTKDALTLPIP